MNNKKGKLTASISLPFRYRLAIWWIASRTAKPYDYMKEQFCKKGENENYWMTKYGLFYGTPFTPLFRRSLVTLNGEFLDEWFDKK